MWKTIEGTASVHRLLFLQSRRIFGFRRDDGLQCELGESVSLADITLTQLFFQTKDPKEIAKRIANEPKQKYNNPRIPSAYKGGRVVVITQSENPVVMAQTGVKEVKEYKVPQLSEKGKFFLLFYIWVEK